MATTQEITPCSQSTLTCDSHDFSLLDPAYIKEICSTKHHASTLHYNEIAFIRHHYHPVMLHSTQWKNLLNFDLTMIDALEYEFELAHPYSDIVIDTAPRKTQIRKPSLKVPHFDWNDQLLRLKFEQTEDFETLCDLVFLDEHLDSPIIPQMRCCQRMCDGECVTQRNKQERKERRDAAEKKRKFLELRKEKQILLRQLERNKKLRLKAQIFDDFWKIPTDARDTMNTAQQTMGTFASSCDKLTDKSMEIMDHITSFIEKIKNVLHVPDHIDLFGVLFSMYSIYTAVQSRSKIAVTLCCANLARQLGLQFKHFQTAYQTLNSFWTSRMKAQMDTPSSLATMAYNFTDISRKAMSTLQATSLSNLPLQTIGTLVITFVCLLFNRVGSIASYSKYLADFGRSAIGFKQAMDLYEWVKTFFLDQYYQHVEGKSYEQVKLEKEFPILQSIITRCEMLTSPEFKHDFLDRDSGLCDKIIKLDEDILRLRTLAVRNPKVLNILTQYGIRVAKLVDAARNSSAYSNGKRVPPFTVYFAGETKCGKTNLFEYLETLIYAEEYANDPNWTEKTLTHVRQTELEYWDGYLQNQPIVLYDDIFQMNDNPTKPNLEMMEIIRAKNSAPMHLHMSAVQDKKNFFFTSPYIFASSNTRKPTIKSIHCPDAVYRRFDLSVVVKVDPNYGTKISKAGKEYYIIDKDKVTNFTTDFYRFDIYDMLTNVTTHTDLTFTAFMLEFNKRKNESRAQAKSLHEQMRIAAGLPPIVASDPSRFIERFKAQIDEKPDEDDYQDTLPDLDKLSCPFCNKLVADCTMDCVPESYIDNQDADLAKLLDSLPEVPIDPKIDYIHALLAPTPEPSTFWQRKLNTIKASSIVKLTVTGLYKLFTTVRTAANKLLTFLKNWFLNNKVNAIITLASLTLGASIGFYLFEEPCKMMDIQSISEAKNFDHTCSICCFGSYALLDTATRAQEVLLHALSLATIEYYPELVPRYSNYLKILANLIQDEILSDNLKRNGHINQMIAESREVRTPKPSTRKYAESREIRTRTIPTRQIAEMTPFARARLNAESREQRTAKPVTRQFAEMDTLEAPLYTESDTTNLRMKAQAFTNCALEQWESISQRNAVSLAVENSGTHHSVGGVFVTGRILLTVKHFVDVCNAKKARMIVSKPGNVSGNAYDVSTLHMTQMHALDGTPIDLILISLPSEPSRRDIRSKFADANSLNKALSSEFVISGLKTIGEHPAIYSYHGRILAHTKRKSYDLDSLNKVYTIHDSASYCVDTKPGDCGSLLYTKSNLSAGKVLGVHVAGLNGRGMAVLLSRELLDRSIEIHCEDQTNKNRLLIDARAPFSAEMSKPQLQNWVPSDTLSTVGNCLSLGMLVAPRAATTTALKPSAVSGLLQVPETKPAYLTPVKLDGKYVNPLTKGISKVLNVVSPLDTNILRSCAEHVAARIGRTTSPVVYTYEEAITGIEGDDYITPLNRATSPGYPYCLNNPSTGKRHWFGHDEYEFSDEIRQDVTELIDCCRNNKRGDVVFVATLKDERRPIEKVEAGKTRVFAAGPQHFTIAIRMYFLDFVKHIMTNRIANQIGVGTNPYSIDWHLTAVDLASKGGKVIAGDFSNFDGSLLQDVLWEVCNMINEFYDDGEENAQIRSVLFEEICNARILVNGELIQFDHSQPSGNPLTVIVNSLFNMIVMRYAYLLTRRDQQLPVTLCEFDKDISMQTFGDDNCLGISDDAIDYYNQITITAALKTIGLTYTDEGKTGELVKYRALSEIRYLKRSFELKENGIYEGPLDPAVCYEMTNWVRGHEELTIPSTIENCKQSLMELALHGRPVFEHVRSILKKELRLLDPNVYLPTFDEYREIVASV